MSCPICERLEKKRGVLCESEHVAVMIPEKPSSAGHLWIVPKTHVPILEGVKDKIVGELFTKANKVSVALFESLGVAGTNIFIENGIPAGQKLPHVLLNVIARKENDGINLNWPPREFSNEEMANVEKKLKDHTGLVGVFEKEKAKPLPEHKPVERKGAEADHLVRALRRLP